MMNFTTYKYFLFTCLTAAFFVCSAVKTLAQTTDTAIIEAPEITEIDLPVAEEKTAAFEPVQAADKGMVQPRAIDEKQVANLKAEDDFWYVNEAPKRSKPEVNKPAEGTPWFAQAWFRNLLWVLIVGGFVVLLVWFLVTGNVQLFQKKSRRITANEAEEEIENIFEIDYNAEIEKAVAAKKYRLAIRLLYLSLLIDLSQKNIIQYRQERTNADYVQQLSGTAYYKNFFSLTRSFEYAWYGNFPVTEATFAGVQTEFTNFKSRLPQ